MKIYTFILAALISILVSSCGETKVVKTPEQLKRELRMHEEQSPLMHLAHDGKSRFEWQKKKTKEATFFKEAVYEQDGALISGTVHSSATVAKFKDIVVSADYYAKTGTLIKSDKFIIYEVIEPNGNVPFNFKVDPPQGFDKYGITVHEAAVKYD